MDGENNNGLVIVIVFLFILIVIMMFRNKWTITYDNGKKCINNYGLCNDGFTCKNDYWGSNCPQVTSVTSISSSSPQPYYIIPYGQYPSSQVNPYPPNQYNPNQPPPPPAPLPYQPIVGGCAGTMFGCCANSNIAKIDSNGSNCDTSTSNSSYGCQHTVFGCCPDSSGYAKIDSTGSNC